MKELILSAALVAALIYGVVQHLSASQLRGDNADLTKRLGEAQETLDYYNRLTTQAKAVGAGAVKVAREANASDHRAAERLLNAVAPEGVAACEAASDLIQREIEAR